ncbi:hypothetical protein [Marinibactrum halimedae]|uniref:SCO family protein n=1 Tax=Marinibactrum halimedae TaxID=1444977 RepID=A0AA37T6J0_9GAMM|nr:hypothetical protein [Marinibactrum halimedae]MCD9461052.1 hypothetical protein [Marinibactrum halimedae]GLS24430.1 hypothetical protein GCM10007877_01410 [Marinibactrum halimedae]
MASIKTISVLNGGMNSSSETPESAEVSTAGRRGRVTAILLFVVLLAPMLVAYFIFKTGLGLPKGTINKGVLIQPALPISTLQLETLQNGEPFILDTSRWHILIPVFSDCNNVCASMLYTTRQVHIRLGKNVHRLARVVITDGSLSPNFKAELKEAHPGLQIAVASPEVWRSVFPLSSSEERYVLVDQNGFMMMSYRFDEKGEHLLKDVERMLKFSHE